MQLYHILGLENVFSVFVREPEAGNYGKGGPDAGTVRARFPAKPMNSVFMREPEAAGRPAGHTPGLAQEYVQEKNLQFLYTIMYYHTNAIKKHLEEVDSQQFLSVKLL